MGSFFSESHKKARCCPLLRNGGGITPLTLRPLRHSAAPTGVLPLACAL